MKAMQDLPVINRLLDLNNENIVSFHVPGHKNGRLYERFQYKNFIDVLHQLDTTEILGTDNLHHPEDVIKESQERASKVFGSEETFFLVNGSTSGIYSMIMAATSPGDKILIDRNCHQSVINAMILGDLVPIYIYPRIEEGQGISIGMPEEEIERQLIAHKEIKAVILTYPTYYGIAWDLKKIGEIVHKYDKILLIDEAHGAHFGLSVHLPPTALSCGADCVVQSTHKTLPSFTQSSMLHIQGNRVQREKLKSMLKIHQSSSPSYLLLSSLDFAVMLYKEQGEALMEELLRNIEGFKADIGTCSRIKVMGEEVVGENKAFALDPTRLWIAVEGVKGYDLDAILRKRFRIQMELSNEYGVLAVTTMGNNKADFDQLQRALQIISSEYMDRCIEEIDVQRYRAPKQVLTPRAAFYGKKKRILLKESIGEISGEYIIPYPPGIPLVIPGEEINEEVLNVLDQMIKGKKEILGLRDGAYQWIDVILR
ncbi:aminotransferase class I/II-fold pyridoxal phosphate-dependent enzyme [Alkaliphilus oremlandii]|uniref:Orn/Lys/Arg decarboxylase major region n=1 Tax=Alkaliphilus oremlandii (strain OhILAs) TaxID=350688 RepID=A8MEF8_ALKOO|nr:aminotransferase class I/II-fold pyridoxal phosphate-dependent enzyme [Alkaliphilus oremlandii]ABW17629.1 Orn/Lys/Arg decarboxylase major region [Alkaliphilus oremlandii OhILAs]